MAKIKFDRFYDGNEIVELSEALDKDEIDLQSKYDKDSLYCPECNEAQLRFTRGTSKHKPFLSTKPADAKNPNQHRENCSYSLTATTRRATQQYYEHLTDEQIGDKLDSAINWYLRNDEAEGNVRERRIEENPGVVTIQQNGNVIHRRLPKRSISSIYRIEDDLLGIPVLIYGKVYLHVVEKPTKYDTAAHPHFYTLEIRLKPDGRKFHTFYRQYDRDIVDDNTQYYLAAIVVFTKNDAGISSKLYKQSLRYIPIR